MFVFLHLNSLKVQKLYFCNGFSRAPLDLTKDTAIKINWGAQGARDPGGIFS